MLATNSFENGKCRGQAVCLIPGRDRAPRTVLQAQLKLFVLVLFSPRSVPQTQKNRDFSVSKVKLVWENVLEAQYILLAT